MRKVVYKLTDENMRTYGGFQWKLGEIKKIPKENEGGLCSDAWLHFYYDKDLAVLLNPLHVNFSKFRLFRAEAWGDFANDNYLKGGAKRLKLVEEINPYEFTVNQKVAFAIYCALDVWRDEEFSRWADSWLQGTDRSKAAAEAARAAWAAWDAWAAGAAAAAWAARAARAGAVVAWAAWDAGAAGAAWDAWAAAWAAARAAEAAAEAAAVYKADTNFLLRLKLAVKKAKGVRE